MSNAEEAAWFDDVPPLSRMSEQQAVAKLLELGETLPAGVSGLRGGGQTYGLREWLKRGARYTAHVFGHIDAAPNDDRQVPIRHAGNIDPDRTLRTKQIKIALGRLFAADYPGSGNHVVLFDFYAKHQLAKQAQDLHYNVLVRAGEGQSAGVLNLPIFVGLQVGSEGVQFRCYTVNVKNEDDEALVGFLDSDVFQTGLRLVKTAQPALVPLSSMALGLARGLAVRNRNVGVQDFKLGLDFVRKPFGACLREGAYAAVQVPGEVEHTWDWTEWEYIPTRAEIVRANGSGATIPYNYVVITVSRFENE